MYKCSNAYHICSFQSAMQPGYQPHEYPNSPDSPPQMQPVVAQAPMPTYQGQQGPQGYKLGASRKRSGRGGLKMIIGFTLGILILSSGGFGGYYLGKSAGIADASGGTPDVSYVGKWFAADCYTYSSSCDYSAVWLKEDGSISIWGEPYFECSDGLHIYGSYVEDGGNDCIDGTDEGTAKAENFNSDYTWVDINELKMKDDDAESYNDYSYMDLNWGINDEDDFCLTYYNYKENIGASTVSCQKSWLINNAMWVKYDPVGSLFYIEKVGNDDTDCQVMLRMERSSGPPEEDNQAWTDLMNLETLDAMSTKPSACSGTTYQELTEGFSSSSSGGSDTSASTLNTYTADDADDAANDAAGGADTLIRMQMTGKDDLAWSFVKVTLSVGDNVYTCSVTAGDDCTISQYAGSNDNAWEPGEYIFLSEGTAEICSAQGCDVGISVTNGGHTVAGDSSQMVN